MLTIVGRLAIFIGSVGNTWKMKRDWTESQDRGVANRKMAALFKRLKGKPKNPEKEANPSVNDPPSAAPNKEELITSVKVAINTLNQFN